GTTLNSIKDVYSHPQALLQCRNSIRELKLIPHAHSNTAQAAADVALWKNPEKSALASPLAAELYGLDVLKEHMQDSDENTTVFIIIAREPVNPHPEKERVLTSILFTLRSIPAALYKALGGFATNGINILKLESYLPGAGTRDSAQ